MTVGKAVEIPMRLKLDDFKKIIDELNNFKKQLFRGNRDEVRDLNELKKSVSGLNEDQMKHMMSVRSEMGAAGMRYKDLIKFQDKIVRGAAAIDKARASGDKSALHAAEVRFSKELQHQSKLNKQQLDHLADFQKISDKTKKEMVEGVTDGVREGLSNLSAADFKSLGSLITSALKKSGGALQTASAVAAKKSGEGDGMISSALTFLAPLLATAGEAVLALAALVVAIGAVIALFVYMDSRISGLNKTLVDSGFAAGDFAASLRDMSAGMKTVRETFAKEDGFDFLRKWSLTQEDALKILGAFNKAGYTKAEMTAGATGEDAQQLKMRNTAEVAIKYGALLGESGEAMAEKIATHMEEAGDTIEQVDAGFASMYESAMKSGFGTSRFFNMVLQATSGLNVYNVRLEEAAGLLGLLGKSMSSIRAGQLLGDLAKRGGEKSGADALRDVTIQGAAKAIAEGKRDAINAGAAFLDGLDSDKLKALFGVLKVKEEDQNADSLMGKSPEAQKARRAFAKKYFGATADMKTTDRSALKVGISGATGKDFHVVNQLLERFKVFSKKGDPRLIAAENDQYASAATSLIQMFDKLEAVLGGDWTTGHLNKMGAETITGADPARIRDLQAIVFHNQGLMKVLKRGFEENKGKSDEEFENFRKEMAETHGYTVDRAGKMYSAKIDEDGKVVQSTEALKSLRDFIRDSTERVEEQDVAKRAQEQAQAAQTIQSETTSVTILLTQIRDFLEHKLFGLMTDIKDYLSDIAGHFGLGTKKTVTIRNFGGVPGSDVGLDGASAAAFSHVTKELGKKVDGVSTLKTDADIEQYLQAWSGKDGEKLSREEYNTVLSKITEWRRSKGEFTRDDGIKLFNLNQELERVMKEGGEGADAKIKKLQEEIAKYSAPSQNDFLLRMSGANGAVTPLTQFNAQDSLSVMGARPGQAVAQAGGTTGSGPAMTFHNHFYNDARANYNQNRKLLAALKHGRPV